MKYLYILTVFLLISCGGGSTNQPTPDVETITFKEVPDDITFLN